MIRLHLGVRTVSWPGVTVTQRRAAASRCGPIGGSADDGLRFTQDDFIVTLDPMTVLRMRRNRRDLAFTEVPTFSMCGSDVLGLLPILLSALPGGGLHAVLRRAQIARIDSIPTIKLVCGYRALMM